MREATFMPRLGKLVRVIRDARGLKRPELAERTGLTHEYISRLERGLERLYPAHLDLHSRLSEALEVDYPLYMCLMRAWVKKP